MPVVCDDFDFDSDHNDEESSNDEEPSGDGAQAGDWPAEPSPGERLLYALGQLYRHHRSGELALQPADFDIEDLGRIIGVWPEMEFEVNDRFGRHYHFPGEVLVVVPSEPFPWRLLGVWEFAADLELNSHWAEGLE